MTCKHQNLMVERAEKWLRAAFKDIFEDVDMCTEEIERLRLNLSRARRAMKKENWDEAFKIVSKSIGLPTSRKSKI